MTILYQVGAYGPRGSANLLTIKKYGVTQKLTEMRDENDLPHYGCHCSRERGWLR